MIDRKAAIKMKNLLIVHRLFRANGRRAALRVAAAGILGTVLAPQAGWCQAEGGTYRVIQVRRNEDPGLKVSFRPKLGAYFLTEGGRNGRASSAAPLFEPEI